MKPAKTTKPAPKTETDLKAALSALCEQQRGRVCVARFVPLAEEARYLDSAYMEQLVILFTVLSEGRFNGSIVALCNKAVRQELF